jgi:hypothetical protein
LRRFDLLPKKVVISKSKILSFPMRVPEDGSKDSVVAKLFLGCVKITTASVSCSPQDECA